MNIFKLAVQWYDTKYVIYKLGHPQGGGGGYFRTFWVGMYRWDLGTLSLYQS